MSETGSILIEKLDIYAYHGFFSEEERLGQRFVLDLVLDTDLRASSVSDELGRHRELRQGRRRRDADVFTTRRFNLLEAAARAVALAVLEGFPAGDAHRGHAAQAGPADPGDARQPSASGWSFRRDD